MSFKKFEINYFKNNTNNIYREYKIWDMRQPYDLKTFRWPDKGISTVAYCTPLGTWMMPVGVKPHDWEFINIEQAMCLAYA